MNQRHSVRHTLATSVAACALGLLAASATAAPTYSAAGSYNLGTDSAAGATASPTTTCGNNGSTDALVFTGAGANSIGIHSYACSDSFYSAFGSRSSGENTYYVDGNGTVGGTFSGTGFNFFIANGEVGAFGSTAFGAGEYQESTLSIKLVIDGNTYIDDVWQVLIGAGGVMTASYNCASVMCVNTGPLVSGPGYGSYSVFGGFYDVSNLADGVHDIAYSIQSMARGRVINTGNCRGVYGNPGFQGEGGEETAAAAFVEGPGEDNPGEPFNSYCGAGAQSGDPFGIDPAIARPLPEPGVLGLTSLALLGLMGLRRRR